MGAGLGSKCVEIESRAKIISRVHKHHLGETAKQCLGTV